MLFVNDLLISLDGKIPDEYLTEIKNSALDVLTKYTITKKSENNVSHRESTSQEISRYLMIRKLEGGSENTIDSYSLQLNNFFNFINKSIENISSDDIIIYLTNYKNQREVSDSTISLYRTILCSFFNWCVLEGIINRNPVASVKPIHYYRQQEDSFSDFEVESLRSVCKHSRDLAIIDFLLSTGCRISELISINYEDIDFDANKLFVIGKGNKKRTVYLNGKCLCSLNKYIEQRGNMPGPLFKMLRNVSGDNRLTKAAIEKTLKLLGKECNVSNVHPHRFRKTMATNAVKRGMELSVIQQILGHENIGVTMRYINVTQQEIENAHRKYC